VAEDVLYFVIPQAVQPVCFDRCRPRTNPSQLNVRPTIACGSQSVYLFVWRHGLDAHLAKPTFLVAFLAVRH
jgi:hypothetical protein